MDEKLYEIEDVILTRLVGKFVEVTDPERRNTLLRTTAREVSPGITDQEIEAILKDIADISPIDKYLEEATVEDIMINNTKNIFVYDVKTGYTKLRENFKDRMHLTRFVNKIKLFATNQTANGNIMDVHLYQGSRANIISSPLGFDVTIRNFKKKPLSIIDLINYGTMDYKIAARLWLYTDGFRVRPANILIGGIPAAGKTTILNTMFSFFRPEQRIVTIEETYELNTESQENTVRLETSADLPMVELVKNTLRMRPEIIIIGEVRGPEANDMVAAMNIGKICMGTIHASSTREIISRLEHSPMNVPRDILPVIDALLVSAVVFEKGVPYRKIVQISEISGIETQVLLSDIYKFDYKTHQATPILPSVTYRDMLSKVLGVAPPDILEEEVIRARILEQLNKMGKRDMPSISQTVKEYYDNPERLLAKIGLGNLTPAIKV
jgi:flagellar protein FlaI